MGNTYTLATNVTAAEYRLVSDSAKADCVSISDALRSAVEVGCGMAGVSVAANAFAPVCAALDDVGRDLNFAAREANRMARSFARERSLKPEEVALLLAEARTLRDAEATARSRVGEVEVAVGAVTECRVHANRAETGARVACRMTARVDEGMHEAFQVAAFRVGMSVSAYARTLAVLLAGTGKGSQRAALEAHGAKVLIVEPNDRTKLRIAVGRWQANREQTLAAIDVVAKRHEANASFTAKEAADLASCLAAARADCVWCATHVSTICAPLIGIGSAC